MLKRWNSSLCSKPQNLLYYFLNCLINSTLTGIPLIKIGVWQATYLEWKLVNEQVMELKQWKYKSILCSFYRFKSFCVHLSSSGAGRTFLLRQKKKKMHSFLAASFSLQPKMSDDKTFVVSHSIDIILSKNEVNSTDISIPTVNTWLHLSE